MTDTWTLNPRQLGALRAICDTLCPTEDGLSSARELGVPEALTEAVALNPREAERRQLALLLSLWDSPALGALGGVGPRRFSGLDQDGRERVLRSWADSRSPQRRAAFQALRKGALLFYYMLPAGAAKPGLGRHRLRRPAGPAARRPAQGAGSHADRAATPSSTVTS